MKSCLRNIFHETLSSLSCIRTPWEKGSNSRYQPVFSSTISHAQAHVYPSDMHQTQGVKGKAIQVCPPRCSGSMSKSVAIIHPPSEFPQNFEFQVDLPFSSFLYWKPTIVGHRLPYSALRLLDWRRRAFWEGSIFWWRVYSGEENKSFQDLESTELSNQGWRQTVTLVAWHMLLNLMSFLKALFYVLFISLVQIEVKKKNGLTNFHYLEMIKHF